MASNSSGAVHVRYQALREASSRRVRTIDQPKNGAGQVMPISEIFGINTFNRAAMQRYLPAETCSKLIETIENGSRLDMSIAAEVAQGMKEWAMDRGATHFCHWFQPQTGLSAEKHDAFIAFDSRGNPIEKFSGGQLIQSEPDASSFPSGGMRSTFEARGYTAWDPSSPALLLEGPNGKTLAIPSAFIGYYGEALDLKTPLLKSMESVSKYALAILKLLGNTTARRVVSMTGPEQEYFLIDRAFYALRPDLIMSGRTLQGAKPPKGQELEDHYFGTIKPRILAFMQEAEYELFKLGIPCKTRHNEVAPGQYELAPIFEVSHIAADHNQLISGTLRRVARRHDLAFIIHEKPFAGVNGSGKHVNWSLQDSDKNNLLEPGNTPQANLQFLVFLMSVLKAVHKRAGIIRASVASAGNDHRLGANEAPPAIMSIFLGEQLDHILNSIEKGSKNHDSTEKRLLSLGISALPAVSRDYTDRNRTSPFAFTGNKFEFRAVGSAFSISSPLAILNTAVAEALDDLGTRIRDGLKDGAPIDRVVMDVVRAAILETKLIRFEGNNYSQEWVQEAERRGLPNLRTTPEALTYWNHEDEKQFLDRYKVFSVQEAESRYHIEVERYIKAVEIEVETLRDMVHTMILPAAHRYQAQLGSSINGLSALQGKEASQALAYAQKNACDLASHVAALYQKMESLVETKAEAATVMDLPKKASLFATEIVPALTSIRNTADWLEETLPDDLWPLPKYREVLFVK